MYTHTYVVCIGMYLAKKDKEKYGEKERQRSSVKVTMGLPEGHSSTSRCSRKLQPHLKFLSPNPPAPVHAGILGEECVAKPAISGQRTGWASRW